jgi:hypothetical protein
MKAMCECRASELAPGDLFWFTSGFPSMLVSTRESKSNYIAMMYIRANQIFQNRVDRQMIVYVFARGTK